MAKRRKYRRKGIPGKAWGNALGGYRTQRRRDGKFAGGKGPSTKSRQYSGYQQKLAKDASARKAKRRKRARNTAIGIAAFGAVAGGAVLAHNQHQAKKNALPKGTVLRNMTSAHRRPNLAPKRIKYKNFREIVARKYDAQELASRIKAIEKPHINPHTVPAPAPAIRTRVSVSHIKPSTVMSGTVSTNTRIPMSEVPTPYSQLGYQGQLMAEERAFARGTKLPSIKRVGAKSRYTKSGKLTAYGRRMVAGEQVAEKQRIAKELKALKAKYNPNGTVKKTRKKK